MPAARFPCPYLGDTVELCAKRERYIAERHPELLPAHRDLLAITLADPDQVRTSSRLSNAKLFSRWYDEVGGGKHVVIVVVSDPANAGRRWIVTAYVARRLAEAIGEWTRNRVSNTTAKPTFSTSTNASHTRSRSRMNSETM